MLVLDDRVLGKFCIKDTMKVPACSCYTGEVTLKDEGGDVIEHIKGKANDPCCWQLIISTSGAAQE